MPHADPSERKRIAREAVATRERNRSTRAKRPPKPKRPGPLSTIKDYDAEVGRPGNWGDVKRREEVRGELILNESRAEDLAAKRTANAKARGELVDLKTVEARDEARDAIFMATLGSVADLVSDLVPPSQLQAASAKVQAWLDARHAEVAAKLEAMAGA